MKPESIVMVLVCVLALCRFWCAESAAGSDPCQLLSRSEAEKWLGEPVKAPELKETGNPLGQKMCLYEATSSPRFIHVSVIRTEEMSKKVREHGQSGLKVYQSTKEMLDPVRVVQGVGDDSFWATPGLHVLKGDDYLVIGVGNTDKEENLELARRIAEMVLSRF
jgi:hypothetical protein